jgi:hypothetical protein
MTVHHCLYNFGNGAEGDFVMQYFMYCNAEAVVCSLTTESPSNAGHAKGQQMGSSPTGMEEKAPQSTARISPTPQKAAIRNIGGESLVSQSQRAKRATSTLPGSQGHVKEQDGSHPS